MSFGVGFEDYSPPFLIVLFRVSPWSQGAMHFLREGAELPDGERKVSGTGILEPGLQA